MGAHDNSNNDDNDNNRKYPQRGLKIQKPIQLLWPLGPTHSKVRPNSRTGRRDVKLSFVISKRHVHELFQSNLITIFFKRKTWKCRRPQEVEEYRRTGQLERLTWNNKLDMELFESDYEIITRVPLVDKPDRLKDITSEHRREIVEGQLAPYNNEINNENDCGDDDGSTITSDTGTSDGTVSVDDDIDLDLNDSSTLVDHRKRCRHCSTDR